jgi:hypothetical protein
MQTQLSNETQFQAWCYQYFHNRYIQHRGRLFHVQQKAMNAIEGNKFRSLGVNPGVSDMIFVGNGFVAFIELKWLNGVQSMEQKRFQAMVESLGHHYFIVKTQEEWKTLMENLL